MKKLLMIFAMFIVAGFSFAQKAGDKVTFSSKDWNGKEITSSIFANNKITMLNIWGTFCPPCIREMPDLAKLNEANKKNGVEVVGIPIDVVDRLGNILPRPKADGDAIIAQTGANYTHVIPSKEMMGGLLRNIQAVPATIFVDKESKIIGQMYLGARSQKDWQKIIDDLLSKQK
ncbi:MAG: TlpA family protein disulfide reductase [Treponema sp.]|nr:TlpA family protein disulfide reductase [Treponema sp.]